ncbi:MAG: glycosyltransferase family 9 protein [Planctomycetota bacterium]|nr:MAG: glycosyltransferase family 9 protein [Planctomycetota bacterium]
MNILVILPRWVGDLVMATPMLRAVRGHFGNRARITGVLKEHYAELLAGTDWLDDFVPYDRRGRSAAVRFPAVVRALRRRRFDTALIVPNSLSTAALAFAGGARRRVGFARHGRRLLLTDALPPRRRGWRVEPTSPTEHAMDLAVRIGVPAGSLRTELTTLVADERLADGVLGRLFPSGAAGPLVVFNDNGAFGPAKSWGAEKFAALARFVLQQRPDARVLVHCGPGDRDDARSVVTRAGNLSVQSLADEPQLPFGLAKALIRRAAVVVSSDSGPRHIAAAFNRPTIALLGPMDPRLGRSDHPSLREMRLDLPCSPCGRRECPLKHHDCMRLLSVDDVGRMMMPFLEGTLAGGSADPAEPRVASETNRPRSAG